MLSLKNWPHCFGNVQQTVDVVKDQRRPFFSTSYSPMDPDIATVLQKISQRVIRELRKLGYLETDTQDVVPAGYNPASD